MRSENKIVILMFNDSLVLKGLRLLLEDMGFDVLATSRYQELEQLLPSNKPCPDLLVLPLEFAGGRSGHELVQQLRESFRHPIPAILLSSENGSSHTHFVEQGVVVLSDRTKPKNLRLAITSLLSSEPVV